MVLSKVVAIGFVFLLLASVEKPAAAEGFYCPKTGFLVEIGMSTSEVTKQCGRPTFVQQHPIGRGRLFRWIYDFGPTSFVQILNVVGDRVVGMYEGDYGKER
jgi:hypothetical protein